MRTFFASDRARRSSSARAIAATLTTTALVVSGLVVLPAAAHAAAGHITGLVYTDFDQDGTFDTGNAVTTGLANDAALSGVTVTAYDKHNVVVGTGKSAATIGTAPRQNYDISLDSSVANGDPLRVEFSGLPDDAFDSFAGADNGTTVQFVTAGSDNVDLGVAQAGEYNPGNPSIAVAIQSAGLPSASAGQPAVVANPWAVAGNNSSNSYPSRTTYATFGQVGAVWASAFDRPGKALFVAATYKRMSGLGTLGLGGIYEVHDALDSSGQVSGGGQVENWLDVATLTDPGTGAPIDIGQGLAQTNEQRGLGGPTQNLPDANAFQYAAKVGIGGVAIDDEGKTLYFVNLHNKKIYGIDIASKQVSGVWNTPAGDGQQAYALLIHGSNLYVGWNDTGSTPFTTAKASGMKYYVAKAPLTNPGSFTTVLSGDLGYQKGNPVYNWGADGSGDTVANANPQVIRWNSWTDTWNGPGGASVGFNTGWGWTQTYPQPVLSTIAIESDGYLTAGFQDRTSIQGGNRSNSADASDPKNRNFETVSGGDMLLASPNADGTYTPESAGTAGSRTAMAGREQHPSTGEGPGGNEFWYDRQNLGKGKNHLEASLGGVVAAPGIAQLASTLMDPLSNVRVTGISWFDSTNGNNVRGYEHTRDDGSTANSPGFQKGGGLGAVSLLVKAAPVEIGNRVWYDADLNGRQDADEPAINGAPVQLFAADDKGAPTGAALGSTTTATINGEPGTYYFRSEDAVGGTPGFTKNGSYVVVFGKAADSTAVTLVGPHANDPGFAGLTWGDMQRTVQTSSVATSLNDSNADKTTGNAPVTVGGASHNDHTIDAGWYGTTTYQVTKKVQGPAPAGPWTIDVASATNFRGDGRLDGATPSPTFVTTPGDPLATEPSFTLKADEVATSTQTLPYGYTLTFAEKDMPASAVAISPTSLTLSPAVASPAVDVTVTNSYTGFTVDKKLTGPTSTASFPIDYEYSYTAAGATAPTTVKGSGTVSTADGLSVTGIPVGATVKVKEGSPLPNIAGWTWDDLAWTVGGVTQEPKDGWVSFVANSTDTVALTLTNNYDEITGNFAVAKTVSGSGSALAADAEFYVDYKVGSLDATTQTLGPLKDGAAAVSALGGYPYGTVIYLKEQTPPVTAGVDWGTPVWTGTTEASDGWAQVTITGDPAVANLKLQNVATQGSGGFTITKKIDGDGEGSVPADTAFQVEYIVGDGDPVTTTVSPDAPFTLDDVAHGTTVRVKELASNPSIPGITWGSPSWQINREDATADEDGYVSFVVSEKTTVDFTVTNHATQQKGAFSLLKKLQGTGAGLVPTDYTVEYKIGEDGDVTTVTLKANADAPTVPVESIPLPATVFVREVAPKDVPGAQWGDIAWTIDGKTATADDQGWVSFPVSDDKTAALVVTNTATQQFGQFQVAKTVTGSGQSLVPDDTNFTFTYRLDGADETKSVTATPAKASAIVDELPFGTKVELCEPSFPKIAGIDWGTPVWSVDGKDSTSDCVTFTIGKTALVEIGVTNTATELLGSFQVAKTVSGTGASVVPDDTTFTLSYRLGAGTATELTVTPAKASAVVDGLPFGTKVTVCESALPSITGVEWGTPSWNVNGTKTSEECATFTIGDTTLVAIALTNTATSTFGTFELTKTVAGSGADRVPGGQSFDVQYSTDRGDSWKSLSGLTKAHNVVAGPAELRVGTVVYLREVAPAAGPSWSWGTPSFSGTGVNPPGQTGKYASFVIAKKGTKVAVSLTNTATSVDGAFAVHKRVTGPLAGHVTAGQSFTVTYTYKGLAKPGKLVVHADQTVTSPTIPVGTVVHLTELAPEGGLPTGGSWGVPTFTVDGKKASQSVDITIGAKKVVQVSLNNPTVPALPNTGGVLDGGLVIGAFLLLGFGGIILLISRRRRRVDAHNA